MPDPWRFVEGFLVAAVVSLLVSRALAVLRPVPLGEALGGRRAAWLGALAGWLAGWYRLGHAIPWPPTTGLDRLLIIVLPLTFVCDLAMSRLGLPRGGDGETKGLWGPDLSAGRMVFLGLFCLFVPLTLLWNSVHLAWGLNGAAWSWERGILLASGLGLGVVGWGLQRLSDRPAGAQVPVGVAAAVLAAGLCVLLAGYIKGGAVAFPLAGSLLGGGVATWRLPGPTPAFPGRIPATRRGLVAWGSIVLYGVLLVGYAFGKLPGTRALLVGIAPLAGWVTEIPVARRFSLPVRIAVGLVMVLLLLGVALVAARSEFERNLGPLVR